MAKTADAAVVKKEENAFVHSLKKNWQLYLMLLPTLVWFAIWVYKPMYGILAAFHKVTNTNIRKGILGTPWVGLENFRTFFEATDCWKIIGNTLLINFYSLIFLFPLTIIVALLLNEVRVKWFKSITQTCMYLPHFISTVVVAGLVIALLSPSTGIVNKALGTSTYFMMEEKWFRTIFNSMQGWQGTGFGTIIYTSALCSIDQGLYEAAALDGASRWKQTIHVTLPGILPTVSIMLILRVGNLLSLGSDTILLLQNGGNRATSEVISTYVYNNSIGGGGDFSLSTAVGLLNSLVSLVLVIMANRVSSKLNDASIW